MPKGDGEVGDTRSNTMPQHAAAHGTPYMSAHVQILQEVDIIDGLGDGNTWVYWR